jgi:ABC-type polysaccharide/polyol phosphate transport system ATPase subunit
MGSGSLGSAASRVTESIDMDEMPVKPIETKKAAKIARSKKLDIALANDSIVAGSIKKLLLLGAGGSGKSTIFKQMKVIYGLNYSEAEKKRIAPVIYRYFPFVVPTTHSSKNTNLVRCTT